MTVTCGATLCGTRLTKLLPSRPAPNLCSALDDHLLPVWSGCPTASVGAAVI
jgi:hypothetical protein